MPWLSLPFSGSTVPPYVYHVMPCAPWASAAKLIAYSSSRVGKRFQAVHPRKYWMIGQAVRGAPSPASATSCRRRSMSRTVFATHCGSGGAFVPRTG